MKIHLTTTRALQVGLLFLLVVCFAQVIWWTVDHVNYTSDMVETAKEHFAHDLEAAEVLVADGTPSDQIERIFPHIAVVDGVAELRPDAIDVLTDSRHHRLRRIGWEGGFFLLVLVLSMAVLWRTLQEENALRRRQQNFIAAVSHEFKSPLASLQLSAETLAMRDPGAERRKVLVDRILDDVQRMEGMASKILSTSKLEQSRIEIHPEPLGLAPVVSRVVDTLAARARTDAIDIVASIGDDLRVHADPVATRMVVQNLIENAVKATAAAGGGRISVTGRRDGGRVVLEVRDTGIGFPPAEGRKIFEKFYRSGDELRRVSSGTGLGLYIVQRLMHHQKGKVKAYSDGRGQGAVFTTVWPPAVEVES